MTITILCIALMFISSIAYSKGNDKVKAVGEITAVSGDTFTVKGMVFTITVETEFVNGTQADLAVGVKVKVDGRQTDTNVIALKVDFFKGGGKKARTAERGLIEAITDDSITVNGTTFALTDKTRYKGVTREELEVGQLVRIRGKSDGDGGWIALSVRLVNVKDKGNPAIQDFGVLTEMTDLGDGLLELVLDGERTYQVSEDDQLSGRHGLKARASDLIEGLTLHLNYKQITEGEDTVNQVFMLRVVGHETISGEMGSSTQPAAPNLESFVVDGKTIYYDDLTRIIGDSEGITDPAELADGTPVHILVNPLVEGEYLANKIVVTDGDLQDGLGKKTKISGPITAIEGDPVSGITVEGMDFAIDENTDIGVKGYDGPFPADLFEIDMLVRVIAASDGDGGYIAANILVYLPIVHYCGEVEAVDSDSLTILGMEFTVDEYTEFKDFDVPTALADISVGDILNVMTLLWPDDSYIATEISPCDNDADTVRGEITDKYPDGDDTIIVVGDVEIVVSDSTLIKRKSTVLDIDDLTLGTEILAVGEYGDDNKLIATKVMVQ
jgi:hypothetical protein